MDDGRDQVQMSRGNKGSTPRGAKTGAEDSGNDAKLGKDDFICSMACLSIERSQLCTQIEH